MDLITAVGDRVHAAIQVQDPRATTFFNSRGIVFRAPVTLFLDINSEATDVKLGDMTGDGSHDILIADRGVWGFRILESSAGGDGAVEFERLSKEQPFFIGQLECGDYNRGDRLDILAAEHQGSLFTLNIGSTQGYGEFQEARIMGIPSSSGFLVGDLDGDGLDDPLLPLGGSAGLSLHAVLGK